MFTELLQAEVWRKKLETAGYKVVPEAWPPSQEQPQRAESRERHSSPAISRAPT